MARFEITSPDGVRYEVTAPEGTSEQEAIAYLKNQAAPPEQPKTAESKPQSWADVPAMAIGNLPASAAKFAHDIVQPVLHPVDTVKGLYNVGYGLASKAAGALGATQDPAEKARDEQTVNALGRVFSDRYGSFDALRNTIATDPVGFAGDASLALTGGGSAAARLPGALGRAGEVAAATGRTIDPINAVAAGARGAGNVATHVLGVTTGTGAAPIKGAIDAGQAGNRAFVDHMRGAKPVEDVVSMAEAGVGQLVKDRGAAYTASTDAMRADRSAINYRPVDAALIRAENMAYYRGVSKDALAVETLGKLSDKVAEFKGLGRAGQTAEGFDALKQAIGEIRETTKQGTLARKVSDQVYTTIKAEIVKQVPTYAAAMKDYANASDRINEMRKTLSINDKATTDTTLRKLQSVMRNNVNTSYGSRTRLADELGKYQRDLMPSLAGQALSSWEPRGIARIGANAGAIGSLVSNPVGLAALPLASPRLIGEGAYALGSGARVAHDITSALGGNALIKALLMTYRGANVARPVSGMLDDLPQDQRTR